MDHSALGCPIKIAKAATAMMVYISLYRSHLAANKPKTAIKDARIAEGGKPIIRQYTARTTASKITAIHDRSIFSKRKRSITIITK